MSRRIVLISLTAEPGVFSERIQENVLHKFNIDRFETDGGYEIANLRIAYRVFGRPNASRDNVILIFHALTGDANCAGYETKEGKVSGWWQGLFQDNPGIDLTKYCVICPNHPTSCYGSSGPLDIEIGSTSPLGPDFPDFTTRDIVRAHSKLIKSLEIPTLHAVVGGSLGGMLALEWAIMKPVATKNAIVMAAPGESSAQSIAFNHIQEKCFEVDPDFRDGHYYQNKRPMTALSLARQMAMITYRSPDEFSERFGRKKCFNETIDERTFEIQSYLDHQGKKFIQRFDANSYLKLLHVLNRHNIARNRGSLENGIRQIESKMLFIGIDTDILYTSTEVERLHKRCKELEIDTTYKTIYSLHGHDSFLIEYKQLNNILNKQLTLTPNGDHHVKDN